MKRITCNVCGKPVSGEVNDSIQVFAKVICPDCDRQVFEKKITTLETDAVRVNVKRGRPRNE